MAHTLFLKKISNYIFLNNVKYKLNVVNNTFDSKIVKWVSSKNKITIKLIKNYC